MKKTELQVVLASASSFRHIVYIVSRIDAHLPVYLMVLSDSLFSTSVALELKRLVILFRSLRDTR